ncbi:MAG TPA: hypothetical protein VF725_09625 [Ktedonobacterales bacterium]
MYSATCPMCGAIIYSTVAGRAWLACQTCLYFGMLLTAPAASASAPTTPLAAVSAPAPMATPAAEDARLGALQRHARRYSEDIAAELAALAPHDCQAPLTLVWDRIQHATEALYRSLGERRMGDYPPDVERVAQALARIGAWHLVALHAAGRLHDPDA